MKWEHSTPPPPPPDYYPPTLIYWNRSFQGAAGKKMARVMPTPLTTTARKPRKHVLQTAPP